MADFLLVFTTCISFFLIGLFTRAVNQLGMHYADYNSLSRFHDSFIRINEKINWQILHINYGTVIDCVKSKEYIFSSCLIIKN